MTAEQRPLHVFVVNGSETFLDIMREFFTAEGCRVTTSLQTTMVYDQIVAAQPNLLMVDLAPYRKGTWDLVTKLQFSPETNRIPLVVVSTSQEELQRAQEQRLPGARTAYLRKPLDLDVLVATLRQLLAPTNDAGRGGS